MGDDLRKDGISPILDAVDVLHPIVLGRRRHPARPGARCRAGARPVVIAIALSALFPAGALGAFAPPPVSSELHTGDGSITNVAVQDICALDTADHITLTLANATGFALSMDALSSDGPASPGRVGARGCAQPGIPGFNPVRLAALTGTYFANRDAGAARVRQEPPLRCYVTGSCPDGTTRLIRLRLTVGPRRAMGGEPVRLRIKARASVDGRLRTVRGATVRAGGRRARTDRRGRAGLRVRFIRTGRRRVSARAPGFVPARATIAVRRPR